MVPWLWFWSPQFHFPFSGSVAQRIEPDTHWFFSGIRPEAGDADTEEQIFDVASYGRQLGLLTEVLLAQADKGSIPAAKAASSLAQLKSVHADIEGVKRGRRDRLARSAVDALNKLAQSDPQQLAEVLAHFKSLPQRSPRRATRTRR